MQKIKDRDEKRIVYLYCFLPFVSRLRILLKLNLIKNEDKYNNNAWLKIDFILKRVEEHCCIQEFTDEIINSYYESIKSIK